MRYDHLAGYCHRTAELLLYLEEQLQDTTRGLRTPSVIGGTVAHVIMIETLDCRQRQLRQQRVPGQPQGQVRGVPQVPGALPLLQQHQETQQTLRGHQPLWDTLDKLCTCACRCIY